LPVYAWSIVPGLWAGLIFAGENIPDQVGLFREQWLVLTYDREFAVRDTLAAVGGRVYYGNKGSAVPVHASPGPFLAARKGRIVAASSDRYELSVFDERAQLRQIVRNDIPNPPVPVSADTGTERPPISAEGGRRQQLVPPEPESAPAFDALLLANHGTIWIRRYSGVALMADWHIYDHEGRWTAIARLPTSFRPTEITETEILGIWRDELDVESVRLFRLLAVQPG
jgi:hypothetical protein